MRSWIGGNAEGRRTFPPKKLFKGYSNFMVFWSKMMEVWFEKQLFRNSRACLCVEGREGLEKALHPFQMGLKQEVLVLQLLHFGSQV